MFINTTSPQSASIGSIKNNDNISYDNNKNSKIGSKNNDIILGINKIIETLVVSDQAQLSKKGNSTTDLKGTAGGSNSSNEISGGKEMVIGASIVFILVVIGTCVLICYRQISRRRMETLLNEEFVRKEEIKATVKRRLAQLESMEEDDSYMEKMKLKVPLVTFGDVTRISPTPSFERLNRHLCHHHHHHHYHYHHLNNLDAGLKVKERELAKGHKQRQNSGGIRPSTDTLSYRNDHVNVLPFSFRNDHRNRRITSDSSDSDISSRIKSLHRSGNGNDNSTRFVLTIHQTSLPDSVIMVTNEQS